MKLVDSSKAPPSTGLYGCSSPEVTIMNQSTTFHVCAVQVLLQEQPHTPHLFQPCHIHANIIDERGHPAEVLRACDTTQQIARRAHPEDLTPDSAEV